VHISKREKESFNLPLTLADFVYTERLNLNLKNKKVRVVQILSGCTAPVHKEAEIRKEKVSFIFIFLVATTFFT
jgi:hypothetical protein